MICNVNCCFCDISVVYLNFCFVVGWRWRSWKGGVGCGWLDISICRDRMLEFIGMLVDGFVGFGRFYC